MNNSPKNITRIAFIISSLTLTLTLLGMSGHTARIKVIEQAGRNSSPTRPTSKQLPAADRVSKNVTVANGSAIKHPSVGRTFYWKPPYPYGVRSTWKTPDDFENAWAFDPDGNNRADGEPGPGDTVVLNALKAGADKDFILLDQDRIIGTLIMSGRDDGGGLEPTLRSTSGNSYKLTVTDRIEWSEGRILDSTEVVAGQQSVVTITGGSLGGYGLSGFLTINGTGSIGGPFTVARGSILKVESKATLTFDSASPVVFDGENVLTSTLDVLGTANIKGTGGIAVNNMSATDVRGTLNAINVSGQLNLQSDAGINTNCDCAITINEGGQLVKSAGAETSLIGLVLKNSGTVLAKSGTLAFSNTFTQSAGETILDGGNLSLAQSPLNLNGGVLAGNGTVTGNVKVTANVDGIGNVIKGIVRPGYPERTVGQLTISGDYTQEPDGKLEIDIGGTSENRHDRLIVNRLIINESALPGTLAVSLINNFHPECNDSFDIVKYISHEGEFTIVGSDLGNGRSFTTNYQPDTLEIVAQGAGVEDADNDGVSDACDNDDDNDCFPDAVDDFRLDPTKFRNPFTLDSTAPSIVFMSNRDGNDEIYRMSEDGTGIERLTTTPSVDTEPKLSPDRSKIAFTSTRHGNYEIYWMNADGTDVTRLTNDPAVDRTPAWSPDGKRIVFTSERDGTNRIYSISVPDCRGETCPAPDATRLNDQEGVEPVWSPNGCTIAFAGRSGGGKYWIFSIDHNGQNLRTLTSTIGREYNNTHPTWSPSGSRIAFNRIFDRGIAVIYTMNPDGSGVTLLNLGYPSYNPAWGKKGILYECPYIFGAEVCSTQLGRLTNNRAFDGWPDW